MAIGQYLRRRGGTYHCRIRIPQKLRFALKKAELVVSLRTGRFAAAARAAREIRVGLDRIMAAVEEGLSRDEIERRVRAWIAELALEYEDQLAANDGLSGLLTAAETESMGPEQATEIDRLMKFVVINEKEKAKKALVQAASGIALQDPAIDGLVNAAARQMKLSVDPRSKDGKVFRLSVLRNLQVLIDASIAMSNGSPIPDQVMGWLQPPSSASAPAPAKPSQEPVLVNGDKLISELWDKFCASKNEGNEWKKTAHISAKTTIKLWVAVNGDRTIKNYTSIEVERFRSVYRNLPQDYYHNKAWKRIYETDGPTALSKLAKPSSVKLTAAKTWNKHLSRLNEFWKWSATKAQALPTDTTSICDGFFIKIPKSKIGKRRQQDLRATFDDQQLNLMLSSPLLMGCESVSRWKNSGVLVFRNHRYWMVLIGILHGMRREEPLVLKVKHVKQENGIWYFDLLDDEVVGLLKDIGSPRHVPLHKDLIEIGFLDARVHGRDDNEHLFPEAFSHSEMKRNGSPFGQWFLQFRRSLGINDDKLDFHAARHTVITRLKDAGVPDSHIEEICGHEGEERRSELATYDHGRLLAILKEGIDKLSLPFEPSALNQAVLNSDRFDPRAANPRLDDPAIVPKPRKKKATPQARSEPETPPSR